MLMVLGAYNDAQIHITPPTTPALPRPTPSPLGPAASRHNKMAAVAAAATAAISFDEYVISLLQILALQIISRKY